MQFSSQAVKNTYNSHMISIICNLSTTIPAYDTSSDSDSQDYLLERLEINTNTSQSESNDSGHNDDRKENCDGYFNNNVIFQVTDNQHVLHVYKSTKYPPNLDQSFTVGSFNPQNGQFTNRKLDDQAVNTNETPFQRWNDSCIDIPTHGKQRLFNNYTSNIIDNICVLSSICDIKLLEDNVNDIYFEKVDVIRQRNLQWHITVPIRFENGQVTPTRIFADPGANTACVNTSWAYDTFPNSIRYNKIKKTMATPGGPITPKFCLFMSFPTKTGTILKSKMYLVNDLPVDILADINMLIAFGYKFKDEVPPAFSHKNQKELNLDLPIQSDMLGNWYHSNMIRKGKQGLFQGNEVNVDTHNMTDEIRGGNEELVFNQNLENWEFKQDGQLNLTNDISTRLMNYENVYNDVSKDEHYDQHEIMDLQPHLIEAESKSSTLDLSNINGDNLQPIDSDCVHINAVIDNFNTSKFNSINDKIVFPDSYEKEEHNSELISTINPTPDDSSMTPTTTSTKNGKSTYYTCMFLMSRQSFLATRTEIERARALKNDELLTFPDFSYLKKYPVIYGDLWAGVYDMIVQWTIDNHDIFATHRFSRKTMNVEPARLGIKPEHRAKTMFARQYAIGPLKRLHMINWVEAALKSGFCKKIDFSLHCIPYLMVAKKRYGKLLYFRPAFDARVINQFCSLLPIIMPTLADFRDLKSIYGFTTHCDIKNCFDCIPLHKDDQKYAVVHTPLGLIQMLCLTYGYKNSAAPAQRITNALAIFIGFTLAYIDDIQIQHLFNGGTKGAKNQLDKMATYCRAKLIQLNPLKFFPICNESESFGFAHNMIGEMVAHAYRDKILALAKPTSKEEVRSLDGTLNYIHNHVYKCKLLMYWINELKEESGVNDRKKRLKWTPQANLAWEQIQWLMANLPLLHHPTPDGKYCLQSDACGYGGGGCLWQWQCIKGEWKWVLIDMYSKVMPKALRHAHSMVQETWIIVELCNHWQFALIRQPFYLATDNEPVAKLFGPLWKYLSPITQRQMLRLRIKVCMFDFDPAHISGLNNPFADGFSRFTIELIESDQLKQPSLRQYPLEIDVIPSEDTNTPELTDQQREELKILKEESNRLDQQLKKLKDNQDPEMINYLNFNTRGFDAMNYNCNYKNIKLNNYYESFNTLDERNWNSFLKDYRESASYLDRNQVNEFIYNTDGNLIRSSENDLDGKLGYEFHQSIINNMESMVQMSDNSINLINDYFYEDQVREMQEQSIMSEIPTPIPIINNLIAINQDSLYDPEDDQLYSDDEDYNPDPSTVETRSKIKSSTTNPTNPTQQRHNFHFEQIRDSLQTRKEFMYHVFGHRKNMKFFDKKRFSEYQHSDNILSVVIKMVQLEKSELWKQEDIQLVQQWDPGLFERLRHGLLEYHDKILYVFDHDFTQGKSLFKTVIPFTLRGKLMDYGHHNLQQHHFDYKQVFNMLTRHYWWSTMKPDCKRFCKSCYSCQFTKGNTRRRAPLAVREYDTPLQHIFADFLGPVYGNYYILVLVDKSTGYTMLIPTDGCDGLTVVNAILTRWVPIFGWFTTFESDWGSGFNNKLIEAFTKLSGLEQELAEPRNHRSIGKVERVIGFLQSVLQHYNQLLDKKFTKMDDPHRAWKVIETILPYIQFGFNQRRPRFTTFSPNMLIFGRQLHDISDLPRLKEKLQIIQSKEESKLSKQDYRFLENFIDNLTRMNALFASEWQKYTWLSKEYYDERYNITEKSIDSYRKTFKEGQYILYFIGDRQTIQGKWQTRWTGPWRIDKIINNTSIIIGDPSTGNQKRVSFDRIKLFRKNKYLQYRNVTAPDDGYLDYQQELLTKLTQYNVKVRNRKYELDYTKRL